MLIDYKELSTQALRGIAESYVCSNLSENDSEINLPEWTAKIMALVKTGELFVEHSELNDSVYLISKAELSERQEPTSPS